MTNICSTLAYDEIIKSGYVGRNQARYLHVFSEGKPMTHRQATQKVYEEFGVHLPERNGRIAELECLGFIRKYDVVRCEYTHKTVNRWIYTGRTQPVENLQEKQQELF